jgi:site-specific DNA-methyltransferase (adenine-specific)
MKFGSAITVLEVQTAKLQPHPFSAEVFPNLPSDEYNALKNDIQTKGIRQPLEILPDFRIIDGHHRQKIALELNLETVPCVVKDLDEKTARLYIITSNLLRRHLKKEVATLVRLKYLEELGIQEHGEHLKTYPRDQKGHITKPKEEVASSLGTLSEAAPKLGVTTRTLTSDLKYGRAIKKYPRLKGKSITSVINEAKRLDAIDERKNTIAPILSVDGIVNGDAFINVNGLPDNSIDLLLTDPPYGLNYSSNRANIKTELQSHTANDDESFFEQMDLMLSILESKLKDDAHLYIFTSPKVLYETLSIIRKHYSSYHLLIWNKTQGTAGDIYNDYGNQYELIIFAQKGKRMMNWDKRQGDVLTYTRPSSSTLYRNHPTEKPVDLLKQLIQNSTVEGEMVLDPFAGSGSTLVAAKQLKRRYCGIEIDKEWYDTMVRRVSEIKE